MFVFHNLSTKNRAALSNRPEFRGNTEGNLCERNEEVGEHKSRYKKGQLKFAFSCPRKKKDYACVFTYFYLYRFYHKVLN